VSGVPSTLVAGGDQDTVADPVAGAAETVIENAGSETVDWPSDTEMRMFE